MSFNNLTLGSTLHVGGAGGAVSFSGSTILAAPAGLNTFNVDAGMGLVLASPVSDGGSALQIAKLGGGYLALSGVNTFSPGTNFQVTGSLLAVGQSYTAPGPATGPLGSAAIGLNNGTLVLASTSTAPMTFDMAAGNTVTLAGSNDSIIAGSTLAGMGVAGGAITLTGSNTLSIPAGMTLTLGAVNGYTLGISPSLAFSNSGTISGGAGSVSLQAGNLAFTGGTFSAASGGTLTLAGAMSGGYFAPGAGGSVILSNTYSGPLASLVPAAGGTLVIGNNSTSGTLNVIGGAYEASSPTSFGPATLEINGGSLGATTARHGHQPAGVGNDAHAELRRQFPSDLERIARPGQRHLHGQRPRGRWKPGRGDQRLRPAEHYRQSHAFRREYL